ncbi:hypothetical protein BG003_002575 [Podila horticola]|nr:hypothetical protein BG003_002575 [Podila horticola]
MIFSNSEQYFRDPPVVIDLAGCTQAGKLTVEVIEETDLQDLDVTCCNLTSPEDFGRIARKAANFKSFKHNV